MQDDDLEQLIDQATDDVEVRTQKALNARPKRSLKYLLQPLFPLVILIAASFIYFSQQPETADSVTVAADLTSIVMQARESVEQYTVDGEYPLVLPDAALGALVNYDIFPGGYFLSIQSQGVIVETDNTGRVVVNGVNQ